MTVKCNRGTGSERSKTCIGEIAQANKTRLRIEASMIEDGVTPLVLAEDTINLAQWVRHRSTLGDAQNETEDGATESKARVKAVMLAHGHNVSKGDRDEEVRSDSRGTEVVTGRIIKTQGRMRTGV